MAFKIQNEFTHSWKCSQNIITWLSSKCSITFTIYSWNKLLKAKIWKLMGSYITVHGYHICRPLQGLKCRKLLQYIAGIPQKFNCLIEHRTKGFCSVIKIVLVSTEKISSYILRPGLFKSNFNQVSFVDLKISMEFFCQEFWLFWGGQCEKGASLYKSRYLYTN